MSFASTIPTGGLGFGIALSAVVTLGCKESPGEPAAIVPCTNAVTISVNTAPPQPQFTWTPACSVSLLIVTTAPAVGTPTEHWRVQADRTVIIPTVTYGRLPTGAQSTSFLPLTSNQDYHISIYIPDRATAVGDASWHQP
jgi:hypothetical protein